MTVRGMTVRGMTPIAANVLLEKSSVCFRRWPDWSTELRNCQKVQAPATAAPTTDNFSTHKSSSGLD